MDILLSALESGANSAADLAAEHDDPGFVALLTRVTQRIVALGTGASSADVDAAAIALVQDVAQFTLSWAEPEGAAPLSSTETRGITLQSDERNSAERRW